MDEMPLPLTRRSVLTQEERRRVQGRRVLFLMASEGHAAQETVKPMAHFEAAGCTVTFATLDGAAITFDPIGYLLGVFEALWDPTLRLVRNAQRKGRFRNPPSMGEMERSGTLESWLNQFDAVVVPGGHGNVFWNFLRDPLTNTIIQRFHDESRVVGLVCHAGLIGAQPDVFGKTLVCGRVVACWPRAADRFFGALPWVGPYMVPYPQPAAVTLEQAGALVHDSMLRFPRVHAVVDGRLATSRGPWSGAIFASAVLRLIAAAAPVRHS